MTLTFLIIFTLLLSSPSWALECVKRDGELVLRDDGKDIPPGPFDCMRISAQQKGQVATVTFKRMTPNGPRCIVTTNPVDKSGTRYTKSEMPTGTYCKYKCAEGKGYSCLYPRRRKGTCACQPAGPRVITVAVVGGKGPDALGETCDDKWEGYEFADAVACTRIQGEFKRKRLVEVKNGMYKRKVESIVETRFMRTEKVDRNLQGCVYVCKKELIKCLGEDNGKTCKCGRVGLRKVLIGMNEVEVAGRIDQTKCRGHDCGPCGVCVKGECQLKKDASKCNNCACGEICPEVDRRKGAKGGKIFCEPNWRLGCRAMPRWMREGKPEPGTEIPNLCTSGSVDALDTCGCAKGYKEYHARFGKTKCRRSPFIEAS